MNESVLPPDVSDPGRFAAALRAFDAANARDPNSEVHECATHPRELLYARRLTAWVLRLEPQASEALRLTAACQHICRWEIPRDRYPMDRTGYLRWRSDLKTFHAQRAGEILRELDFPAELIARVQLLNLKQGFPKDAECRVLEDALCLVFLEWQFPEFARRTPEAKVINAVQKSWLKMTPRAREHALRIPFDAGALALLQKALAAPADQNPEGEE